METTLGDCILRSTFINTIGYAGASIAGATAATTVGSFGTIIGVTLVGSALLYIPTKLLGYSLECLGLMNTLVSQAINLAYAVGSAALGAVMLGLAIKPVIICACIGLIMCACILALASGDNSTQASVSAADETGYTVAEAHWIDSPVPEVEATWLNP